MRAAHCVRINRIPRPNVVTAATIPLALGLVVDVYVVITKIVGSRTGGLIAGSLALVLLIGLWHAHPLVQRTFETVLPGEAIFSAVSGEIYRLFGSATSI